MFKVGDVVQNVNDDIGEVVKVLDSEILVLCNDRYQYWNKAWCSRKEG